MLLRSAILAGFLVANAQAATFVSGSANASYLFPDSALSLFLDGGGISISAPNVATGASKQLATGNFNGFAISNFGTTGQAAIDSITSGWFQFSLSAGLGDLTGTLTLYQPFTTQTIASATIETTLTSTTTTQQLPYFAQTIYTFTGQDPNGGSVGAVPEPALSGLVALLLCAVIRRAH